MNSAEAGAGASTRLEKMTSEPVRKLILRLAAPTTAIMLVSSMYNMADTYFVSSLGTSATAAVGVALPLMAIIQALGFFFGNGSGNYISRALGAGEGEMAEKMAATGVCSAFISGVVITIFGTLFLTPLAKLLGSTATIMPYARGYLLFILIGAPFMIASISLNNLLRFQGSAFFGMLGMVSGAVLNIALDPLLIFVFRMGTAGASLATMISQTASFAVLYWGTTRAGNVRVRLRNFTPRPGTYAEILRGGLPSLLRQGMMSVSSVLLNNLAGGYGDAVIAAVSIVNRIVLIANSAIIGLGQGFQPVCGFNYGARLYDRVRKGFWFCFFSSTAFLLAVSAVCFAVAPQIIALFRRDDLEVVTLGAYSLRAQCIGFPLMGWVVFQNMMLQTIGEAVPASFLAFARQGLFLVPLLFILEALLGVRGIQLCTPIADIGTFLISLPIGIHALRKLR
ncbi:MAG: MATE family efflux transporter [Oscillospiraceae bacterium]|jgi:putative MATE family efflux protein|nr:MATE family efflux transporter [Oscillospiraceae bacterium]